jgi:hypothetical protein
MCGQIRRPAQPTYPVNGVITQRPDVPFKTTCVQQADAGQVDAERFGDHPMWPGNPGSMSHFVLDRDVMPACHRDNRRATTHEPNTNPSAGCIALGCACPGEMDAIPVSMDSIPRLAPEDVRTRTAAVTSHNCHSGQQKLSAPDDTFSTAVTDKHGSDLASCLSSTMTHIECRGILNGARGLCKACYARWLRKQYRHKRRVCRVCRKEFSTVRRDRNSA